ncbi:MAG: dephospho-CoA kinase [Deltaproteobacteria bacterium]|nr:dephospho-CoA kinase [Deltaproteobacteria bacterium]
MIIGLTGGIASGKTIVAEFLKGLGVHVIDADEISREITKIGTPAYKDIVNEFGTDILKTDRTINRKRLGEIVFANDALLKKLNKTTHPRIIEEEKKRIRDIQLKIPDAVIVVNAALLIETGHYKEMDKIIVVYVDEETQIERLMARDGITEAAARMRLSRQMPLKEKVKFADFVIDNSFSIEKTKDEAAVVFKKMTL